MEFVSVKSEPLSEEEILDSDEEHIFENIKIKNEVDIEFCPVIKSETDFQRIETDATQRSRSNSPIYFYNKRFKTENDDEDDITIVTDKDWEIISDQRFIPQRYFFMIENKTAGPIVSEDCIEPIHYFKLFFTDSLIQKITNETNLFGRNKIHEMFSPSNSLVSDWNDVTTIEMSAFLGIILNMGLRNHPTIEDYWNADLIACSPFYQSVLKLTRFRLILCMLHLSSFHESDSGENKLKIENSDKTEKISPYFNYLNKKFKEYYVPDREIIIEESGFDTSGRICFIRRKLRKPHGRGIQLYTLVDFKSGYVFSFVARYSSKITGLPSQSHKPETGVVVELFEDLQKTLPTAEGYHIFTDKAIANIKLADKLYSLKAHLTSTLNENDLPVVMKALDLKSINRIECIQKSLMILKWNDGLYVTNWFPNSDEKNTKNSNDNVGTEPCTYSNYKKIIKEACKADDFTSTYPFIKMKLRWWKKLFFWGLEMCLINSYILYKENCKIKNEEAIPRIVFIDKLINQLVNDYKEDLKNKEETRVIPEQRLDGKLHILHFNKNVSCNCMMCIVSDKKPKKTSYSCVTCDSNPFLHPGECFKAYHTSEKI